jgi:hypothetical protein
MNTFTNTQYSPLLETFDAMGWIPTIRGNLSLNVFDDSNSLLGDVDKFAVEVKTYQGFSTSRYLVASSLFTYNDNKKGKEFDKTFRFIFRGTINDEIRQNEFISQTFIDDQEAARTLFTNNGLLLGKLSIIKTQDNRLTTRECRLLRLLKDLKCKKEEYTKACEIDAASCERLADLRIELKTKWEKVEAEIITIEDDTDANPIYKFDVVLSRDGILFLKDNTSQKFLSDYYVENTYSDYKKNIPVHRIFKTAMNFMKSLFHMDYHHRNEHDASLPATNLHPIRANGDLDKIIKHQTDILLNPITKIKRYPKKYTLCNPEGLLVYAESFLHVFEKNEIFHDLDNLNFYYKFIEKQKKEFEAFSSDHKTIHNFFLSQKNILATFTIALSILIAVIKTLDFFQFNDYWLNGLDEIDKYKYRVAIISICLVSASFIHRSVVNRYVANGKFSRVPKGKNLLDQDSDIDRGRFSLLYRLRLWWINKPLIITKSYITLREAIILVIFWLVVFMIIIAVIIIIWFKLLEIL